MFNCIWNPWAQQRWQWGGFVRGLAIQKGKSKRPKRFLNSIMSTLALKAQVAKPGRQALRALAHPIRSPQAARKDQPVMCSLLSCIGKISCTEKDFFIIEHINLLYWLVRHMLIFVVNSQIVCLQTLKGGRCDSVLAMSGLGSHTIKLDYCQNTTNVPLLFRLFESPKQTMGFDNHLSLLIANVLVVWQCSAKHDQLLCV